MSSCAQSFITCDKRTVEDSHAIANEKAEIVNGLDRSIGRLHHMHDVLLNQSDNLRWAKVDTGRIKGVVVEHNGQIRRTANRAKMLNDSRLRRPLEVRKDDDHCISVASFRLFS